MQLHCLLLKQLFLDSDEIRINNLAYNEGNGKTYLPHIRNRIICYYFTLHLHTTSTCESTYVLYVHLTYVYYLLFCVLRHVSLVVVSMHVLVYVGKVPRNRVCVIYRARLPTTMYLYSYFVPTHTHSTQVSHFINNVIVINNEITWPSFNGFCSYQAINSIVTFLTFSNLHLYE